MQTEKLQHAIGAIHVRFGDQALPRANRQRPAQLWPTGQLDVDRLCGIGGRYGDAVAVRARLALPTSPSSASL